ncbi:acyl--CoA ligase [Caenimonas sedimenti]|uniref:Acyl--CoA ligase n=1 Tax=Caenimonas sedimenti TaxID=2596921 RepID=A0A562ZXL1_9BURK|nr:class I adenylate-forming enzyme family protein [Caenimonas sedimenti]TWO73352.1 acyl--CoA ligase [Caenimonas sedimenti]
MRVDHYVTAIAADPARADVPALLTQDEQVSYRELADRITRCAGSLAAAGLAAGQRAVLVGENSVDMIVVLLAVMRLGAWAVPLNARMSAVEIDGICAHCAPRLCYFSGESAEATAHAGRFGAAGGEGDGLSRGSIALREDGVQPDGSDDGSAHDVAVMIYTSGSTGKPKGVMLTHANLDFVSQASLAQQVLLPGDRIFHALPISHSFGLISALLCALRVGASLLLCTRFSAEQLADALRHRGMTVFQGVPAMYARLIEWAERSGEALTPNRLRMAYIGGSQIDATRKAQAERLLGIRLHHGYGLTESAPAATRTFGHPPPSEITAGWPIPGIEVVVRDGAGQVLPPGEPGEVCIRGPNVMKGYFRDPDQTRAAIDADGWLHTGDVGRFGPEGDLTIVGRIKEMIIRGGFNVYPAEVEAAIAAHAGVAQCAVLGHAVAGDEEIVAFIEPQAGARIDTRALEQFLRGRLSPYKIPRRWHVMDRLPAAATGKLLKPALREMLVALAAKEAA